MAKNQTPTGDLMDRLVALCKRRGIIFPSSDIYGGVGSTYDYGPAGVEIKNNLARHWWREMTLRHENIVGLDSAIILHPKVWEASGHVSGFNDPMLECSECRGRFREDDVQSTYLCKGCGKAKIKREGVAPDLSQQGTPAEVSFTPICQNCLVPTDWERTLSQCPRCGAKNTLTAPRQFNLMYRTNQGPIEDEANAVYLRPETAQGMFLDWRVVQETSRLKPPFGIAQIGKAFRNEITTKNFIFRTREFEQMEMQFFVKPSENEKWLAYWKEQRWNYCIDLGVRPEKLRWHQHEKLAHYARDAWDIEYEFPFGWSELEGLHDRGDFDLSQHQQFSGKDQSYFDDESRERYILNVIEASSGLNRALLMLLCEAYREDVQAGEERVYLALDPRLSPVKAAVFPLVKKDGLFELAHDVFKGLLGRWPAFFDEQGSIGKRYRRQDELGTPFCFTVDYQTKEDGTVTVRWRDTLLQERIAKDSIGEFLLDKLEVI